MRELLKRTISTSLIVQHLGVTYFLGNDHVPVSEKLPHFLDYYKSSAYVIFSRNIHLSLTNIFATKLTPPTPY